MAHYLLSVSARPTAAARRRGAREDHAGRRRVPRGDARPAPGCSPAACDAPEHGDRRAPDGGRSLLTDGPYLEGKEYVGGLSIIEAPDLDAALEWGRKVGAGDRAADRGPALPLGMTVDETRRRARRLPRGVRPRRRRAGPPLRRHRPRRGGGPGGVRRRGAAVARERAAAGPGGLDRHHRPQPGDRPAPPGVHPRRAPGRGRPAARRGRRAAGGGRRARRPAPPDLHVLPPGAGPPPRSRSPCACSAG